MFNLENSTIRKPKLYPLSSKHRLHYPWEFKRFFNQSQVFKLGECIIFRIENDLSHCRLGITLKARGSSLERNQVKRQIREAFRTRVKTHRFGHDYNIVIPKIKKMSFPYPNKLRIVLEKFLENDRTNF